MAEMHIGVGSRRVGARATVALTFLVGLSLCAGTACAPASKGGGAPVPESMDVWAVGDSISVGYATHYPGHIGSEAVSGSSFVYHGDATKRIGTIGENTTTLIGWFGLPSTIVMMGGTNDARYHISLDTVQAAIVDLTASLSVGTRVVHVTEPGWTYAPYLASLNSWLKQTYPDTIDCAPMLADPSLTSDGVHPSEPGYGILARCIYDGLHRPDEPVDGSAGDAREPVTVSP